MLVQDPELPVATAEQIAARDRADVRHVLSDPRAERFLCWLLETCLDDGFQLHGSPEQLLVSVAQRSIADLMKTRLKRLDPEGFARFEARRIEAFARRCAQQDASEAITQRGDARGFGNAEGLR